MSTGQLKAVGVAPVRTSAIRRRAASAGPSGSPTGSGSGTERHRVGLKQEPYRTEMTRPPSSSTLQSVVLRTSPRVVVAERAGYPSSRGARALIAQLIEANMEQP